MGLAGWAWRPGVGLPIAAESGMSELKLGEDAFEVELSSGNVLH